MGRPDPHRRNGRVRLAPEKMYVGALESCYRLSPREGIVIRVAHASSRTQRSVDLDEFAILICSAVGIGVE